MLRWCLVSLVSFFVAMQIPSQGDIVRDDLVIDYSLLNVAKRSKVSKHMKLQNKKILMLCNRAKKENFAKSFTKQQMPLAFNLNHSFRLMFFNLGACSLQSSYFKIFWNMEFYIFFKIFWADSKFSDFIVCDLWAYIRHYSRKFWSKYAIILKAAVRLWCNNTKFDDSVRLAVGWTWNNLVDTLQWPDIGLDEF